MFWERGSESGVLENENSEVIKLLVMKGPGLRRGVGCGRMEDKMMGGEEVEEPPFPLISLFRCSLCPSFFCV